MMKNRLEPVYKSFGTQKACGERTKAKNKKKECAMVREKENHLKKEFL